MKKRFTILLSAVFLLSLVLLSSSFLIPESSQVIKFEKAEKNTEGFHEIRAAEKTSDGVIYYSGESIFCEKDGAGGGAIELADDVRSLWRDGSDIYYTSHDTLYTYDLLTEETKEMAKKPYIILGKYDDNIISYYGKNIYSINEAGKTKIFKDGYYLNSAVLYHGKVYGIPASNVYEYDLTSLRSHKVTDNPEGSFFKMTDDELYIMTMNRSLGQRHLTCSKMTDEGLQKEFVVRNTEMMAGERFTKDGPFIATQKSFRDSTKGNLLLYIQDGKKIKVDEDCSYYMAGIIDNQLCYYKNKYSYGTGDENLTTFYLYDGKESKAAFDLDVGYFEDIDGFEYDGGLLIEVAYEMSTDLYQYDGKTLRKLETPDNFYRLIAVDVIDDKAYVRYSDGEESMEEVGVIIHLDH